MTLLYVALIMDELYDDTLSWYKCGFWYCQSLEIHIANDGVAYLLGRYEEGTLTIDELSRELTYLLNILKDYDSTEWEGISNQQNSW